MKRVYRNMTFLTNSCKKSALEYNYILYICVHIYACAHKCMVIYSHTGYICVHIHIDMLLNNRILCYSKSRNWQVHFLISPQRHDNVSNFSLEY